MLCPSFRYFFRYKTKKPLYMHAQTTIPKRTAGTTHHRPVALFTPYCESAHIHTILHCNSITAIQLYVDFIIKQKICQEFFDFFTCKKILHRQKVCIPALENAQKSLLLVDKIGMKMV